MTSIADLQPSRARRSMLARPLQGLGRRVLTACLSRLEQGRIDLIENGDRQVFGDPSGRAATLEILDPGVYGALGFGGSCGAAEAFMAGQWRSDNLPRLIQILAADEAALASVEGPIARLMEPATRLAYWLQRNSRRGSAKNIIAHYDLGDEFFALFLDPTMTYSCALFERGATTLEQAQREKIDRACRKLALTPDDHLLEIGTGWGSLALHAAHRYGCRVTTTTISPRQAAFAKRRIAAAGLSHRVEVLERDYRDLEGRYDKLVSIEMIEAVGAKYLPTYFDTCSRLLAPHGMMMLQAITIRDQHYAAAARSRDFLKQYVFPGSCLPSVAAISESVRDHTDLGIFHLEEIGPHYAETLARWRHAFLRREEEVRALGFDEQFTRLWEFYLCYCEGTFLSRRVGATQLLLAKPRCQRQPFGCDLEAGAA
ncbi:MAG: cyclopropane-fatty-acyl-phospholipid synthase family protein [Planctomycetota bacterium]